MTTNENKHFHKHLQYVVDKIHIKNSVHGLLLDPHSPHQAEPDRDGCEGGANQRAHLSWGWGGGSGDNLPTQARKRTKKAVDEYQSDTQQNRETNRSSSQVSMHTVPS